MLTPRDVLDELIYPFRDAAMLLAILVFTVLFTLSVFAGLFGLWLLIAIVPAFFQYLLVVMQARADKKEVPAVDVELFSLANRLWSLFPLVLVSFTGVVVYFLVSTDHESLAVMTMALAFLLLPPMMATLTITHSAIECLRPSRMWLVARNWGRHYLLVLVVSAVGVVVVYLALRFDLWVPLVILVVLYCFLLIASVGGHAMAIQEAEIEISIPDPVLPSEQELMEKTNQVRTGTLNHAYGMVSRGNRAGGVHHILEDIKASPDQVESYRWFFKEMLRWDSPGAAAVVGQQFVSLLLAKRQDQEAIKTIVRCRHANPDFKLLEADRVTALRLTRYIHDPELRDWLAGNSD